ESPVDLAGGVPPSDWGTRQTQANRPAPSTPERRPDFLAAIRQRRYLLAAIVILLPVSAWIALHQIIPLYTATGSLVYQATEYQPHELQSLVRADPITEQTMATQAEILQSLKIAEQVAQRGSLFDNPWFNPARRPPGLLAELENTLHSLLGMDPDDVPSEPVYG